MILLSFLFTGPGRNLLRGLMAAHGLVQGVDPVHPVIRQALAQTGVDPGGSARACQQLIEATQSHKQLRPRRGELAVAEIGQL